MKILNTEYILTCWTASCNTALTAWNGVLLTCKLRVLVTITTRASVLHKARISVDSCGDVDGMIVERKGRLWCLQQWNVFFDVFVFAFKEKHMRPVVTKWATSRQGTEGGMAHWTFQKSIENKGIWQGENSFGPQIRQQPWHVIYHFEPGHILEMDFCDLSLILWEQVSYCLYTCWF